MESLEEVRHLLLERTGFVSDGMDTLLGQIHEVSYRLDGILILGESGTGKTLIVNAIDALKAERGSSGTTVSVNCAAIPDGLLESELFGHTKGAFTTAHREKPGLVQMADNGRLFLDEIGAMPEHLQAKLLKVVEDGEVRKVGSNEPEKVNFQVLAATSGGDMSNGNEIPDGMRPDLYWRLSSNVLHVPPFRKQSPTARAAIIRNGFLVAPGKVEGAKDLRIDVDDAVVEAVSGLAFPGNTRQVINAATGVFSKAYMHALQSGELNGSVRVTTEHFAAWLSDNGNDTHEQNGHVDVQSGESLLQLSQRVGFDKIPVVVKLLVIIEMVRGADRINVAQLSQELGMGDASALHQYVKRSAGIFGFSEQMTAKDMLQAFASRPDEYRRILLSIKKRTGGET